MDHASVRTLAASVAAQLPSDLLERLPETHSRGNIRFDLPRDLVSRLRQRSAGDGRGIAPVLLAAFAVLLNRYTQEEQLALSLDIYSRPGVSVEPGLPLQLDFAPSPRFEELSAQVAVYLERLESSAAGPVAPAVSGDEPRVTFLYQHHEGATPPAHLPDPTSALQLAIYGTEEAIQISWSYSNAQFEPLTIVRMHHHWQNLLVAISQADGRPVTRLPLLSDAELQQQLYEWNATAAAYPDMQCIHQLFEEQVRTTPEAPALVFGPVMLSYHGLNQRANQLAHYLQQMGAGPGTLVGLHLERSLEMFIGILGILKAGCAYLPLDPEYPQDRLAFMIEDAGVPVLLTTRTLADKITINKQQASPQPALICFDDDWPAIAQQPHDDPEGSVTPDDLAYVIYTSGSTGRPKGTRLAHRGLCNLAMAQRRVFPLGPGARVLQFASCSFDASVWEWVMALTSGSALYIARQDTLRSLTDLTLLLRSQAISIATLPPSLLALLPNNSLPELQTIITAGEACTANLVARWASGRQLFNAYGPTETTICASWYQCDPHEASNPPIGRPLPNMQLFILDRLGQPLPVGVPGELYIGGFSLAHDYLNRPELTAERFINWTMAPGQWSAEAWFARADSVTAQTLRLYRTGDMVRFRQDGTIEFLGRIDNQVKLRGFRIEPGEIEAVLQQHPAVGAAIVHLREDVPGVRRLVAYLIAPPDKGCNWPADGQLLAGGFVEELQAYLRERLPEYMLPALFVGLDALPLTPNGKVDRRRLPQPQVETPGPQASAAPRSRDEQIVAEIWAQVLGLAQVGIHDDFFALGGNSLAAAHAVTLVGQQLGKVVPLRQIYTAPTVAAFAQAMYRLSAGGSDLTEDELAAEVMLDPAITPVGAQPAREGAPQAILLTGVTGFLGAFLLQELLEHTRATIYCLVRANTREAAAARLEQTLATYQIALDGADYRNRIVPLPGDLSLKRLGLSAQMFQQMAATIDVIYHSGANVHYLHPYANLKPANVDGTVEVIRLACSTRIKPVHYISTIAVAIAEERDLPVGEDAPLRACHSTKGYDQSKWVAEGILRLARARGLPVNIYRPGRVTGHTQSGAINNNDFFVRMLSGCLQLRLAPKLPLVENLVPVDYVVQAIVHLSQQPGRSNHTFHLLSPYLTHWQWVVATTRMLGYELGEVSYQEWHRELMRIAPESFGQVFHNLLLTMPSVPAPSSVTDERITHSFDMHNTTAGLANSMITCTPVDVQLLERMLVYAAQHQFFMQGERFSAAKTNKAALVPQHCF